MKVTGRFDFELRDPDGGLVREWSCENGVTYQGIGYILGAMFLGLEAFPLWRLGLIDGASPPTLMSSDTASSHSGWTENTAYTGSRPLWSPPRTEGDGMVLNTNVATFTMTGSETIYGAFLIDDSGVVLYSTAAFDEGNQSVTMGQSLNVRYTIIIIPT